MKKIISLMLTAVCTISAAQAASLPDGRVGNGFDFSVTDNVILSKFTKKDTDGNIIRSAQIVKKTQDSEDDILEMTSNAGDTAVTSYVQLSGDKVSFSEEPQAEEVIRYSFEVSREGFGENDVIYVENNLVSGNFSEFTTSKNNYRPINIVKITGAEGSVKFWGENGGSERALNGIKLDEKQWCRFDLLIYRDMGARLYINGVQYTTGTEDLLNGRYYTTLKDELAGGTIDTGAKNISIAAAGGNLKLYMVPKDDQKEQKAYFDNVSVELMSESKAMEEITGYALCGNDMLLQSTNMTVGEFKNKISFNDNVKVYTDAEGTTPAEDDAELLPGMVVQIFNSSYEISELYGKFSFTKQENGTVLASFYTNAPEDMQIFAAHYLPGNELKAVKYIDIKAATGVRRIKTTTESGVEENETLKILWWKDMKPLTASRSYTGQ